MPSLFRVHPGFLALHLRQLLGMEVDRGGDDPVLLLFYGLSIPFPRLTWCCYLIFLERHQAMSRRNLRADSIYMLDDLHRHTLDSACHRAISPPSVA